MTNGELIVGDVLVQSQAVSCCALLRCQCLCWYCLPPVLSSARVLLMIKLGGVRGVDNEW